MNKNKQIKLDKAIKWTKGFRGSPEGKMKVANAFLIPVEDLVGMLVEMKILVKQGDLYSLDEGNNNDVRAYMAVDPKQKNAGGQKLVMVATQKFPIPGTDPVQYIHKDIINGKIDNKTPVDSNPNSLAEDGDPNTGIYDFTRPCPNTCDPDSPLLNGNGQ